MALQTSGAISLNDIHVEAGGSSGTTASLNDADIRDLINKASGASMSFSEWYGASAVQYSLSAPTFFWLTGSQGQSIYWNGSYIGAPASSSTTSFSAGGYTYTRGSLQDTISDKSGTYYYYALSRS